MTRKSSTQDNKSQNLVTTIRFNSEEEIEQLKEAARHSGFAREKQSGVSSYIRKVVLNYHAPSTFDKSLEGKLNDLREDLGRLGALLKEDITNGASEAKLRETSGQLHEVNRELKELIRAIRGGEYCSSKGE